MAAGLGFKDFVTGEVLTAADVDGYLMQGIWVFASAAARDAAVTSPQEGNACYLKDTNEVLTYSGSAWVAVGGGGAGLTKITSATFSAVSSVSFPNSTFTSTYKDYLVELEITTCSANMTIQGRFRASGTDNTSSSYSTVTQGLTGGGSASNVTNAGQNILTLGYLNSGADQFSRAYNFISPQLAVDTKVWGGGVGVNSAFSDRELDTQTLFFDNTTQFDSFSVIASTGNFTGRYAVYGLEA